MDCQYLAKMLEAFTRGKLVSDIQFQFVLNVNIPHIAV